MLVKGKRVLIYGVGMVILAFGVALNTKTGLGVPPIVSVSYCAAQLWGFSLGDMTFAAYCLFVAVQLMLRGRNSRWYDLLQIPFSLLFGRALDLIDQIIGYDCTQHGLLSNVLLLCFAILLTGIGVSMTVNMKLLPNPPDGVVQAIAEKTGKGQGITKNLFDSCCVLLTITVSLVMTGRVIGIGLGTVIAMLGVGRVIAMTDRLAKEKMCRAAGLWQDAVKGNGKSGMNAGLAGRV